MDKFDIKNIRNESKNQLEEFLSKLGPFGEERHEDDFDTIQEIQEKKEDL